VSYLLGPVLNPDWSIKGWIIWKLNLSEQSSISIYSTEGDVVNCRNKWVEHLKSNDA
jgi:hypothetical protein